ncbi:MAG: DUF3000 domain-containing protein [Arachnia sp.]
MAATPTNLIPPEFSGAIEDLGAMTWRREVSVEEIGSPQRIAPHSLALEAEFHDDAGEDVATGRLILLHDPAGNGAWHGTFRLVSYVRAEVDLEMVTDPLLPDVAWTWLTDALDAHAADHHSLAGTVTASFGKGFGQMSDDADRADVEVRSSWTPKGGAAGWLIGHLRAWQDLLGHVAGHPPLPAGIVAFPGTRS